MTKTSLASTLYPNLTYDSALPQPWVDLQLSLGFDPVPCVVWGYPSGCLFGVPFPLTPDAEEYLLSLNPNWGEIWDKEKA
jgi:hypothetical protein